MRTRGDVMTLDKIIIELEKRQSVLHERLEKYRYERSEIRYTEPFRAMTDKEIGDDPEIYRKLLKKEKPYTEKIGQLEYEKSRINDILYAYRNP